MVLLHHKSYIVNNCELRVLNIIAGLSAGGAERALYNILAGGLKEHHDHTVLSLQGAGSIGPKIRELGVPVYALHMRRGIPTPGTLWRLRCVIRNLGPDVIQGWMYHGNLAASLAGMFAAGRPAVVWNVRQSLYDLAAEKPLTRKIIRANHWLSGRVDTIIYNSRVSRRQHEAFGFESARGLVVPNGFDLKCLKPNNVVGEAIRQKLGIPRTAQVIGHVARFHPMKDHVSFLRAAVHIASVIPNVRFLVVGRDVSLENPALAGIVPAEFIDRFIFPGECLDAYRLMHAMDVFCLSSWSEAFPNVLGEAMACGVPCVTTDVGDCANIVENTGVVVPPSDSKALAQGLLAMLEKPDEMRRALGRAARERVECHYGLDSVVAQYIDLYEKLAAIRG